MGLYLCIFDAAEEEIDAVDVGSYADYNRFLDAVVKSVELGDKGSVCPTLTMHHDSDGEWTPSECLALGKELDVIEEKFRALSPVQFPPGWMQDVTSELKISPKNLCESFIDIDGMSLVQRIRSLCKRSVETGFPIVFQ